MNSQPSSVSIRSIVRVGGGAPATTMRTRPRPGIGPVPLRRRVEDHVDDGRRAAHQRDAVVLGAAQDLGAVDLAQHDVLAPMPVTAYSIPQPLQWNWGSVCR